MLTTYTRSATWSIVVGVLLLVVGLLAIALPFFASIAASIFFGWLLMVASIAHLVYAWSERGAGAVPTAGALATRTRSSRQRLEGHWPW